MICKNVIKHKIPHTNFIWIQIDKTELYNLNIEREKKDQFNYFSNFSFFGFAVKWNKFKD